MSNMTSEVRKKFPIFSASLYQYTYILLSYQQHFQYGLIPTTGGNVRGEKHGGTYVDCIFGDGAHSREILERLSPDGRLFAFDCESYKHT